MRSLAILEASTAEGQWSHHEWGYLLPRQGSYCRPPIYRGVFLSKD